MIDANSAGAQAECHAAKWRPFGALVLRKKDAKGCKTLSAQRSHVEDYCYPFYPYYHVERLLKRECEMRVLT